MASNRALGSISENVWVLGKDILELNSQLDHTHREDRI